VGFAALRCDNVHAFAMTSSNGHKLTRYTLWSMEYIKFKNISSKNLKFFNFRVPGKFLSPGTQNR